MRTQTKLWSTANSDATPSTKRYGSNLTAMSWDACAKALVLVPWVPNSNALQGLKYSKPYATNTYPAAVTAK